MAIKFKRGRRRKFTPRRDEELYKVNQRIRAPYVRVVGDSIEGSEMMSLREALDKAYEMDMDLVEISPKAEPPVCRIIDYKKFLYQRKKKQKELKAKSVKVVTKEIRFGPNTNEHDFNFKMKHAERFLNDGAKVKAYVFFKGRSILFKEQGEIMLLKLAQELGDQGVVEQMPKLEGKKMTMLIAPKKKK